MITVQLPAWAAAHSVVHSACVGSVPPPPPPWPALVVALGAYAVLDMKVQNTAEERFSTQGVRL